MKVILASNDKGFAEKLKAANLSDEVEFEITSPAIFDPAALKYVPDLLVLEIDDERPQKGATIIQALKKRETHRNVPVVALSTKPTKDSIKLMHQAGVRDILTKAIDSKQLNERLGRYASRKVPSLIHPDLSPVGAHWHDQTEADFKKLVRVEAKARLEMLPSLPTVVSEILKLTKDSRATASDFEERIRQDQALAARILRMANAGFYAQKATVKSIHDATVILGVQTLKSLVLASSTNQFFDKAGSGYGYEAGGLWKHSISCALGSQFIGKALQLEDQQVDELFVHGLLHDVGKLLLNPFLTQRAQEYQKAILERQLNPLDAETAILGTNHCVMGMEVADHWKLPDEVKQTIQFHECIGTTDMELPLEVKVTHTANYLCHLHKLGLTPNNVGSPKLDSRVQEEFGINAETLPDLSKNWRAQLDEAYKLFSLLET